jgi:CHAD domain-containing protein
MAYRFKRREPVAEGFRRIVDEQVAGLLEDIATAGAESVHSARRRCKMLRALLELPAAALDRRQRERADDALEKIARSLAPVRDAEVRLQTLEALLASSAAHASESFAQARGLLRSQAAAARRLVLTASDLRDVVALVKAAQARLLALVFDRKGWRAIGPGLARSFRRGRRSFAAALDDPSPEVRHHWRKQVKLLWNHLRVVHGCHPKKLSALPRQLDALGETLGTEHDLAMLRQHLAQHGKRHRSPAAFHAIVDLIDSRRTQLRRTADAQGRALYRQKPAAFAEQIERAWHVWRK